MRDVTQQFEVGVRADDDLVSVLMFEMGQTRFEPSQWVMESQDDTLGLVIHWSKAGAITRIDSELSVQRNDELAAVIRDKLAPTGTVWNRRIIFSMSPLKGDWELPFMALRPVPDGAPVPDAIFGRNPMVLEYVTEKVSDGVLTMTRSERRGRELELVIGALAHGTQRQAQVSYFDWGYPYPSSMEVPSQFQPGYRVPGLDLTSETPMPSSGQQARLVPIRDYYGNGLGDEFELPDAMQQLVLAWSALPDDKRRTFLRSAYWLREADERFSTSASVALVSAVQAVESLLPEGDPETCGTCGQPVYRLTRRFREFLESHGRADTRANNALYGMRSKLTHGAALLDRDVTYTFGYGSPVGVEQDGTLRAAITTARVAAVNWLVEESRTPSS
jgi:hypothetical protein